MQQFKPHELEICKENYWLSAKISEHLAQISIAHFEELKLKEKLVCIFDTKSEPSLNQFSDGKELFDFLKNQSNYSIDFATKSIALKWNIVANGFQKSMHARFPLKPGKITELDCLKHENVMLRKKLSQYENKRIISIGSESSCESEKNNIKIEFNEGVKENELSKPSLKGSTQQNDKATKNKATKDKTKQIKKRGRPPRAQKLAQQQKIMSPPTEVIVKLEHKSVIMTSSFKKTEIGNKIRLDYQNGDYYFGEMIGETYHGYGLYCSKKSGSYEGDWVNGRAEGQGVSIDQHGNIHEGHYKNDVKEGRGIDTYINGETYQGEFHFDLKEGYGRYTFSNGDYYEGFWKKDLCCGKGKEVLMNGCTFEGFWRDDEKDGEGILVNQEGVKFKQVWAMGILESSQILPEQRISISEQNSNSNHNPYYKSGSLNSFC